MNSNYRVRLIGRWQLLVLRLVGGFGRRPSRSFELLTLFFLVLSCSITARRPATDPSQEGIGEPRVGEPGAGYHRRAV